MTRTRPRRQQFEKLTVEPTQAAAIFFESEKLRVAQTHNGRYLTETIILVIRFVEA
jgi:hypothetical protein